MAADRLARRLLPVAREGLVAAGVEADEADGLLDVIDARVAGGMTGAVWQRRMLERLEPDLGRAGALAAMLEGYLAHSASEEPVHAWPLAP